MLHIEWTMPNRETIKEFRQKLDKSLKKDFFDSFQFTENYMVLTLDLGRIYSYRDMKRVLRYTEEIRTTWCFEGFISCIDFKM